jgi:hypothetical protein
MRNTRRIIARMAALTLAISAPGVAVKAQDSPSLYTQAKATALTGLSAVAENVVLKRDRGQITFQTGTFYFGSAVNGHTTSVVFIGSGTFHADLPPAKFEQDNARRLLKADAVDSDFRTAVLRFTDDTLDVIAPHMSPAARPPDEAARLLADFDHTMLEETGANIPARLAASIANHETPGFFVAGFDRGRRGHFVYLLDPQCRIPVANFEIDSGEKGLIFDLGDNHRSDVWTAFYSLGDYQKGTVSYPELFNLVDVPRYAFQIDLRVPRRLLKYTVRMDLVSRTDGLLAIPFAISENLPAFNNVRRDKGLHLRAARLVGGPAMSFAQEEWEGGFTLMLPSPVPKAGKFSVELDIDGEFTLDGGADSMRYMRSNEDWYPRHGHLIRSTFDLTFLHNKNIQPAAAGLRVREDVAPDEKNNRITEFTVDQPVPVTSFAAGPFKLLKGSAEIPGGVPIQLEAMGLDTGSFKSDFILAEMSNAVRWFSTLFGPYPYPELRAINHPFGFGQGFPGTLFVPNADTATFGTFSFLAHETSHQWWGDQVMWRSYRDQWLSEGFAEYSGMLYAAFRQRVAVPHDVIDRLRDSLKLPPRTEMGIGTGRLTDIGPLVLGHRVSSSASENAYTPLIYNKGGLVLRMLHFLFTDPQTGNGQPFFDMMSEFVKRHANGAASTEDFFEVASSHVSETATAKRFGYKNLNWFLQEWVYSTLLPSYRLEYQVAQRPDGKFALTGTLYQDGIPETEAAWFMALPLVMRFPGSNAPNVVVIGVNGAKSPVNVLLPAKPDKVELDPDRWILSDKTESKAIGR